MSVLALPLLPLLAAGLLVLLRRRSGLLGPLAVGALLATLALGGWTAAAEPAVRWRWSPAIELGLAVSGFGRVMAVLVPLIAAPIVAYAAVSEEGGRARLLALLLAFVGAMEWLVLATDFLTLLIGWELVGAASWALIAHDWRNPEAPRSATVAFVTTRVGDLGLYAAAGLLFAATGSFAFDGLSLAGRPALDAVAAGVLLAATAKSAQLPFSSWLFAAMAGPTPVSALLHSATLVAAGAYLLIRLAPALASVGWFLPVVAGVGLATALAGGVVATVQPHVKRALAASTSAQYGLMFVAVGTGATAAAGAHLVAHAAFKSLMFLGAGIAMHAVGTGDLAGLRLGRALPRVAALSAVGALALAAVPPLGGAWTKEQIVAAAVHASPWLAAGVFLASFLSAVYAARYQLLAYGPPPARPAGGGEATAQAPHHRPGAVELAGVAALAGTTLLLSALWLPGAGSVVEAVAERTLGEAAAWELGVALALIVAAFALVWGLDRGGRLASLGLPSALHARAADWLGLPLATRLLVVNPVLSLSRALAWGDARVVDAGVRGVAVLAAALSRLFSRRAEWTIDGAVRATALGTLRLAGGSRVADEAAIDGAAVEGSARLTGRAGHASRRLQTGLAHHYYVILAVGLAVMVAVLLLVPALV
ncbi:MAG: NADH-quinone oxidoreductase subunit L [Chloroflexi bacterium]|nr:NADH-quinone oxidoreductase subunit L [Chloroflexota bacterium]